MSRMPPGPSWPRRPRASRVPRQTSQRPPSISPPTKQHSSTAPSSTSTEAEATSSRRPATKGGPHLPRSETHPNAGFANAAGGSSVGLHRPARNGTSRMLSRLGGVVVMGRSAHRAIAGSEWVCRARFEGFVLQYVRCTVGFSSPEQGCEEAAFRVEQASEQPVRAPVLEPVLGPPAGEPDVEVAELVEHSGAVEQRAAADWIQLASSDVERGSAGVRVEARTVLGSEGGHEPAQGDLGGDGQGG